MILAVLGTSFAGCRVTEDDSSDTYSWVLVESTTESSGSQITESNDSKPTDNTPSNSSSKQENSSSSKPNSSSKNESTSSSDDTDTLAIGKNDKSSSYKNAYLRDPIKSKYDAQATNIRNKVLNAKDSVSVKGKIWYISNSGDDKNSGDSKSKAWATVNALKKYDSKIKSGDAVLFERGGIFRGGFSTKSGVYYGAYGSGDKPCIYGSHKAMGKWSKKSSNIWVYDEGSYSADVGVVVFDHGKAVGMKKISGKLTDLKADYDFTVIEGKLYVRIPNNPTTIHKSIEVGLNSHLISMPDGTTDVTIDNLTVKYAGGHGIRTGNGSKNITIKNCELGFIGGSILDGYGDGTTRYGNAIEFWQGIDAATVTNCWIYQIFDTGVTHQGSGNYVAKNIKISGCLIEYCGFGSIEYWHNQKKSNYMENVEYSDNVMRFSGFGYGGGRRNRGCHIHSNGGTNENYAINFVIKNNIFDLAYRDLLDIRGGAGIYPTMIGNTYSQYEGKFLGSYGEVLNKLFNSSVSEVIKGFDEKAKIVFN